MKTQNTKLVFNKKSISELNREELIDINGGTSPLCVGAAVVVGGAFLLGVIEGVANEINDDDPNENHCS